MSTPKKRALPHHPILIAAALGLPVLVAPALAQTQTQRLTRGGGLVALPPAPVDWAAVARDYNATTSAIARRAPGLRQAAPAVDRETIPILLPHGADLGRLVFIGGVHSYTVSLPQPSGVSLALSGDSVFVGVRPGMVAPPGNDALTINGQATTVNVADGETGQSLSFMRYGVVYTLEVDCVTPASASYCNGSYIRQLAASLTDVVLGGTGQKMVAQYPPPAQPFRPKIDPNLLRRPNLLRQMTAASSSGAPYNGPK